MNTSTEEHANGTKMTNRVRWRSPSNIAIVKYWGKHGEQLPANPSISLTLSSAYTDTSVAYTEGKGAIEFYFNGEKNDAFAERVSAYVGRLKQEMPSLEGLDLLIESSNSFPHSAGIASSASAMSALALCLNSIAAERDGSLHELTDVSRVSGFARLGSGSASRSVAGPVMLWGRTPDLEGSSDDHAVLLENVDPIFESYMDSILIVSDEEKQVKSSAGHSLMNGHPYADRRFDTARMRIGSLLKILEKGDVHAFGRLAEQEAMDLHAMMMTSTPPYLLMRPGTVAIIEALQAFRQHTGHPVYMTLDAGPNVHMLYPGEIKDVVMEWIDAELKQFCTKQTVLHDKVGHGPKFMVQ
jgi:diphosphomevalonate decarboxylase